MHLGFVRLLLRLAVAPQSAFGVLVVALTAGFLQRLQIAPGERWLGEQFGAEFEACRCRVRRRP